MEGIGISIRVCSAKLRNPRPKSRNPPPLWKEIASAAPRLSVGIIARVCCAPTLIMSPVLLPRLFPHLCATNQEDARCCLRRGACWWSSGVRPLEPEPPAVEAPGGESQQRSRCIGHQWGWFQPERCRRWIGCSGPEEEWPQISAFPRCYPTQEDRAQWHALPSMLGINIGRSNTMNIELEKGGIFVRENCNQLEQQDKGSDEVVLKAMGRAINKIVMAVELIKEEIKKIPLLTASNFEEICGEKTPVCIIGVFGSNKAKGQLEAVLSEISKKTLIRGQNYNSRNAVSYALLDKDKQSAFLSSFDKSGYRSSDKLLIAYKEPIIIMLLLFRTEGRFGCNVSHVNTYSGIAEKSMDKFAALISSFRYPGPRVSGLRSAGDVLEDNPVGRLKVYVYDLPSKYNKKLVKKDPRCLNHMFAAEIFMHRFLLSSVVRTFNPEEADWFYTPVYATCDLTPSGLPLPFKSPRMMRSAIELIATNWPYWNRLEGAEHFFVTPHDFGACFHYQEEKAIGRGILPLLQRATLVQTFGQKNHVRLKGGSITIPPFAPPQKMQAHLIPVDTPRSIFVYFRGLFYDTSNDPEGGYYAR
ncbi:putative glucuronosyltransferase [Zea mays]|uniref:Putative glucuronosyltransferase n=1 Tax=Zea mays TaxID=4577 RepID=A0A3L6FS25_MAIZE|nr:putative glucuronosyltransferase [Zea mays]